VTLNVVKRLIAARRERDPREDAAARSADEVAKRKNLLQLIAAGIAANKFPPR